MSKIFEDIADAYPLSMLQAGMVFHSRLSPDSAVYHDIFICPMQGRYDFTSIKKAVQELADRHPVLRTSFNMNDFSEPLQLVHENVDVPVWEDDIRHLSKEAQKKAVNEFVETEKSNKFSWDCPPLYRYQVFRTSDEAFKVIFSFHHSILDGWSAASIMTELYNAYQSFLEGRKPYFKPLPETSFRDYVAMEREALQSEEDRGYWIGKLDGVSSAKMWQWPLETKKTAIQSRKIQIPAKISSELNKLAKAIGVPLKNVLLAAHIRIMALLDGGFDIVTGVVTNGRPEEDGGEMVAGLFLNTLPFRMRLEGGSWKELILHTFETERELLPHRWYPLLQIQKDVKVPLLFESAFNFTHFHVYKQTDPDNAAQAGEKVKEQDQHEEESNGFEETNFSFVSDFSISVIDSSIHLIIKYDGSKFDAKQVEAVAGYYGRIFEEMAERPEGRYEDNFPLMEAGERSRLLEEWQGLPGHYPGEKTIHRLFEEQAASAPDNTAVAFGDSQLTYRELNEKANRLAGVLREKGVKRDIIVGIMADPSLEMIIGIMGILKAGGAYLPIDPGYPGDRIEYMLYDSGSKILLTHRSMSGKVKFGGMALYMDDEQLYADIAQQPETSDINTPDDMAYVIYTSGSTGTPKGVAVEHKSLVNLCFWHNEYYGITEKDRSTKFAGFGFDASVWEIFPYLIAGAALHIIHGETRLDIIKLNEYFEKHGITASFLPTQICEQFLEMDNKSLRVLMTGGDRLKHYTQKGYRLINNYGPTENTVVTTCFEVDRDYDSIPIGKPIASTRVYIVNRNNHIQPVGIAGELCISGDGLARGYLNRPELTREKFVPCPFAKSGRMYRTGDLARWLPDGNIEFLGRMDSQVKIRGYRIELGEIENRLLKYEPVREAVVLAKEDADGNKYLCAYYAASKELELPGLREHLSKELPDYMIPAYFFHLDSMPLTQNGKVDAKALPEPDGSIMTGSVYIPPQNETEEKLAAIWQEVLGVRRIGTGDNFFELGGHSLKVTRLVSEIHKELNVEIPLGEVFKTPTISQLARYMENAEKNLYASIQRAEENEYYPMSSAQKRLYILSQMEGSDISYNMPQAIEVKGRLDKSRLEDTFRSLIERHESLRTSFEMVNGEPVQRIHREADFKIFCREGGAGQAENALRGFVAPFDLCKAPLLRVELVKLEENRFFLLLDMHHIISDGVSMGILIKEFAALYAGRSLPELNVRYRDYAVWQEKIFNEGFGKKQQEHWLGVFSGEIPVLDMAADYPRPAVQSFEGDNVKFRAGKELGQKLSSLAVKTGSTLYMVLLAAYNVLLYKYTGQEDIIVGSPVAGRPHGDLEGIMGMFVNTLAQRNSPKGDKSFEEFLGEVRENSVKAYENQDYPFEELVGKLELPRDMSRNPLFDTMFSLQNMTAGAALEIPDLSFGSCETESKIAKFDLTLDAAEDGEGILLILEYCTKLFKKDTAEGMAKHFLNILSEIAKDPSRKISEIDMLSNDEKNELIYELNPAGEGWRKEETVHSLFEIQAGKAPGRTAILFEGKEFTYGKINENANRIAKYLKKAGSEKEEPVVVLLDRSPLIVEAVMGIWKAGGAYIPIDPDYPGHRVLAMLEESGARYGITLNRHLTEEIRKVYGVTWICLDSCAEEIGKENGQNLNLPAGSGWLAYVIYTSGSTGRPKGAMIEHAGMLNHIRAEIEELEITEKSVIAQNASHCFDVSVWQFFAALTVGAKIAIYPDEAVVDVRGFTDRVIEDGITILEVVPSFLSVMLEYMEESGKRPGMLQYLLATGETVKPALVKKWFLLNPGRKLVNAYGPAEASDDVTQYAMDMAPVLETVPIGKPIKNMRIYIADRDMNLCPKGAKGEICVSGIGVGRGYLNNEEKTREAFMQDPFVEEKGIRLYKTGDIGRWLPDGNLEFHGRKDYQVKIRGHRIELEEISGVLLMYPGIREAVATDRTGDNGDKYLCAYISGKEGLNIPDVRNYLSMNLPSYMVPAYITIMEALPLSPNGKVDRKALPEPASGSGSCELFESPEGETEERLAALWKDILGAERVGRNDNFFELGGHSLKATNLASAIHKEFNIELPLGEIFRSKTLAELAKALVRAEASRYLSIEPAPEREYYSVSSAQKRLYLLDKFGDAGVSYNMPAILEIEGNLDRKRLEDAFRALVKRHETLRTSFLMIEGEIVQRVADNIEFNVEYIDASENPDQMIKDFVRPFDLGTAPLFRVQLIGRAQNRHILMLDMHHIISDAVSEDIFVRELSSLYAGGRLESLRLQYKDYANWQNRMVENGMLKKQEEYWLKVFGDEIPVLNINTDYKRPSVQSFEGGRVAFEAEAGMAGALNSLAKETGTTMYMVLLAAYNTFLYRYTGQEDIAVGSPVAGRPHTDLQGMMGVFVNTLAMRNCPGGEKTFRQFLAEVKENCLRAYENQDYQFEELVEKLNIKRDMSRNPLFDTMLSLQNTDSTPLQLEGLKFRPKELSNRTAKFDLTLSAQEFGGRMGFEFEYCTRLFKEDTIRRLAGHFINILRDITANPDAALSRLNMLADEEKEQLLHGFNNTKADYPRDKTIHRIFEEQAERTPDNTAVICGDSRLTYSELNGKANSLARVLREKGAGPDRIVGIMAERSLEMIVGIFGILKAGGAYLPIDPGHPEDRIKYIIKDSGAEVVLAQEKFTGRIEREIQVLNIEREDLYNREGSNLEPFATSRHLAYVIYTSGSTGNPKGVMIEHYSVINRLGWMQKMYPIGVNDAILQKTPYTFDVSVWELFWWSHFGAKVCMLAPGGEKDPGVIVDAVEKYNITTMHFVPSMLTIFLEHVEYMKEFKRLSGLRQVFASGEALNLRQVEKFNEYLNGNHGTKLHNLYGPTEATVDVSYFGCSEGERLETVPIGKPIDNISLLVLNANNALQPVGVAGELCIGGDGLARGYLNKPELTLERFVPNPFAPGERMYRTGDLVSRMPDGNIEFLGRMDYQVKIRGFRIELGEIEARLLKHGEINEAVVMAREDAGGGKYLCAYYASGRELPPAELRKHLSEALPDYMVPSYFVHFDKMPLSSNGKINRKALPEPSGSVNTGAGYTPPGNRTEEKLAAIWQDILGVERVGTADNFFELGGHSLKAVRLVSEIHREFNVEIPLREIFKSPTISQIAYGMEDTGENIYAGIRPVEEKEYYPMSAAQRWLYILSQLEDGSISYNMPEAVILEGSLDRTRIEDAFRQLAERHESLRTSFGVADGELVQRVHQHVDFEVGYGEADEKEAEEELKAFLAPFELGMAPLLRVRLVKLGQDRHMLLFDMHHIISDAVSMGILLKEFTALYNGNKLPELRIQYKDFSAWQKNLFNSGFIEKQQEYWLDVFKGEIPVLNMGTDYQRPAMQSFEGDKASFAAEKETVKALNGLARETGATMYMVLLAAYNALLYRYTGQDDLVVGSPAVGRPHRDLRGMIGVFVNTLAMRNYPKGEKTFREFLLEVKENCLMAYENQDYQFEELVEKLKIKRDMSRNPLFDTMFTLQNAGDAEGIHMQGLKVLPFGIRSSISRFDISLSAREYDGRLGFELEYCTRLFREKTVKKLAGHFINILNSVASNPDTKLSELDLLAEEEKQELLFRFNDTAADYPGDKTIHELFEAQAERTPDNIALTFGSRRLTYRELNNKANSLARVLMEKGVGPDRIVGIMAERSLEMLVAVYGVLKAGGAYLPVDPAYPQERIEYMLSDSSSGILLTKGASGLADRVSFKGEVVNLEDQELFARSVENIGTTSRPDNLVYVIYTSGSTGLPKGTMIRHRSVCNLIKGMGGNMDLSPGRSILSLGTMSFDISIMETLVPLSKGLEVVIANESEQIDPMLLNEVIMKSRVEILEMTPSRMKLLTDRADMTACLENVKEVLVGGEALPPALLKELQRIPHIKIYNLYGPTEATVWSTFRDVTNAEEIDIGKPISNTSIYILDSCNNLQPVGVPGELCIGGDGLARGYLNRTELTREKFVPNPFIPGKKMYRTGDLARWLPDGNIEYIGRMDHQIKIRGYRIELGEIETQLLKYDGINEAVVAAREDSGGGRYLCAYYVSDRELTAAELRKYLSEVLPDYMVPSYFVRLDAIPLTPNGKINRKALPEPDGNISTGTEFAPPAAGYEKSLAELWQDVLKIGRVGVNDNFFELGGHSLGIISLAFKVYEKFNVKFPLMDIMKAATVRDMARYIEESKVRSILDKDEPDRPIALLNGNDTDKSLFAFPPMLAHGLAFLGLAGLMEDTSFYAFDFIEADSRVEEYVKWITGTRPGPYVLFGFSLGGNLAFEVACELEKHGHAVSDIIILDSTIRNEKALEIEASEEGFEDSVQKMREDVIDMLANELETNSYLKEYCRDENTRQRIFDRVRSYMAYEDKLLLKEKVKANVHFIASYAMESDEYTMEEIEKITQIRCLWSEATTGEFRQYRGFGKHHQMLQNEHIAANANIIGEIMDCIYY